MAKRIMYTLHLGNIQVSIGDTITPDTVLGYSGGNGTNDNDFPPHDHRGVVVPSDDGLNTEIGAQGETQGYYYSWKNGVPRQFQTEDPRLYLPVSEDPNADFTFKPPLLGGFDYGQYTGNDFPQSYSWYRSSNLGFFHHDGLDLSTGGYAWAGKVPIKAGRGGVVIDVCSDESQLTGVWWVFDTDEANNTQETKTPVETPKNETKNTANIMYDYSNRRLVKFNSVIRTYANTDCTELYDKEQFLQKDYVSYITPVFGSENFALENENNFPCFIKKEAVEEGTN